MKIIVTKKMNLKNWTDAITAEIKKVDMVLTETEINAIINALEFQADADIRDAEENENKYWDYDNWDDDYDFWAPEAIEERSMLNYRGHANYLHEIATEIKNKQIITACDINAIIDALKYYADYFNWIAEKEEGWEDCKTEAEYLHRIINKIKTA